MKPINCWKQNQHTEEVQLFIKRNSCHITQDTLNSNRTVYNVLAVAGPHNMRPANSRNYLRAFWLLLVNTITFYHAAQHTSYSPQVLGHSTINIWPALFQIYVNEIIVKWNQTDKKGITLPPTMKINIIPLQTIMS